MNNIETKKYSVNKVKQLIDLNGQLTNFDVKFTVTSKDKASFDLLVVDQTTLDSISNLEYKKIEGGSVSGNITYDKNIFQNHYLILKSDNPVECEVTIERNEIQPVKNYIDSSTKTPFKKDSLSLKKILIIVLIIVLIAVVGIYFYKKYYSNTKTILSSQEEFSFNSPNLKESYKSPKMNKSSKYSTILERLKNINIDE